MTTREPDINSKSTSGSTVEPTSDKNAATNNKISANGPPKTFSFQGNENANWTVNNVREFFNALFFEVGNAILGTIRPILILAKNTVIFGVFLLLDSKILEWIKYALKEELKDPIAKSIFHWIYLASAIIIGLSYLVRLAVELITHRDEYLGISRSRRDHNGQENE